MAARPRSRPGAGSPGPGRDFAARLAAVQALATAPGGAATAAAIGDACAAPAGILAAAALRAAIAHGLDALAPVAAAAFARFAKDPDADPRCQAKLAALEALDAFDHDGPEPYRQAAALVQAEPVWGGSVDTAGPLRVRAGEILLRRDRQGAWPVVAELLGDPLAEVRGGIAGILGEHGDPRGEPLLRLALKDWLRLRRHDADAPVGDLLAALLRLAPETLPLVAGYAQDRDPAVADQAILAIGSRRDGAATAVLAELWPRLLDRGTRRTLLGALDGQRSDGADQVLLELVRADDPPWSAEAAAILRRHAVSRPGLLAALETAGAAAGPVEPG